MKHLLVSFLLLVGGVCVAQKNFFYVRYSPSDGNSSSVVRYIEDQIQRSEEYVIFLSYFSSPLIAKTQSEWLEIRQLLLTMQVESSLYDKEEYEKLNELFVDVFREEVEEEDNGLFMVKGEDDKKWTVTFIMSEPMYSSKVSSLWIPNRLIEVNEFRERGISDVKLQYDSGNKLKDYNK